MQRILEEGKEIQDAAGAGACAGSKVPRDTRTAISANSGVLPALGARAAPPNRPPSCALRLLPWAVGGRTAARTARQGSRRTGFRLARTHNFEAKSRCAGAFPALSAPASASFPVHFRACCLPAADGGSAGAAERGLAWPIGAASSAPHFPPATADPAAQFSRPGHSRRGRRIAGLRPLAGLTAGSWPGCELAVAPLVRDGMLRTACRDSGRGDAFLRRQVLVCALISGSLGRRPGVLQLMRSTGCVAGLAHVLPMSSISRYRSSARDGVENPGCPAC